MSYIFIDESGDLGFNFRKKGTSRYFLVAAVKVDDCDKRSLEKVIKKIYSDAKSKYVLTGVLHATEEREATRRKVLNLLRNTKCEVVYAVVDKVTIYKDWDGKADLYERMVKEVIMKISEMEDNPQYPIVFSLSRWEANKHKNSVLLAHLEKYTREVVRNYKIQIKKPAEEKGLQVVDFISWAIFSYLNGDNSYFEIIQNKIVCTITHSYKKQNRANLSDHPLDGPVARNYLLNE